MPTTWEARSSAGRRGWIRSVALVSIALLGLAAAAHFKHHLDDPDCGSTPFPSHVCFCAGLHGGVLGEQIFTAPSIIRVVAPAVVLAPCSRVTVDPAGVRATRAPPLA